MWTRPFFRDDQLIAAQPQGIQVGSVAGCGWQPWAASPFEAVDQVTVNQGHVFWVERYPALTVSRIFAQAAAGSPPVRLVETSGPVTWFAADEEHVYWLEDEAVLGATEGAPRLMQIGVR